MIYPAQTSLIPIQIALTRFLEEGGNISGNYPYWYLGTTPYRYLTGPILPPLLAALDKLIPNLSLFELSFIIIAIFFLIGGLGLFLLVEELGGERRAAVLATVFYLFGPFIPFFFPFTDGLFLISFSLLPFILLLYSRFLKKNDRGVTVPLAGLIVFLLLLNTSIIPTLLIGMAVVFLALTGWEEAEEKLKRSAFLLIGCLLVVTLWYTPSFWLTRLGIPSLAGRDLVQVIFDLGKLLPTALAITAAFVSVKFFKERHLLRDFVFYWLFIFGFLTLMRFISDPDFWLDWSRYNLELQFGLAAGLGLWLTRIKAKNVAAFIGSALIILIWGFLFNHYTIGTLQSDIHQTVEYQISQKLNEATDPGERVLLSGTTAFWLNAFFDVPQVRGGVDQASVEQRWREAIWEIREGEEIEKSLTWLRDLGISYLVVHTQDSREYYHDFTHPEKFEDVVGLEKIYEERGDRIYRVLD